MLSKQLGVRRRKARNEYLAPLQIDQVSRPSDLEEGDLIATISRNTEGSTITIDSPYFVLDNLEIKASEDIGDLLDGTYIFQLTEELNGFSKISTLRIS